MATARERLEALRGSTGRSTSVEQPSISVPSGPSSARAKLEELRAKPQPAEGSISQGPLEPQGFLDGLRGAAGQAIENVPFPANIGLDLQEKVSGIFDRGEVAVAETLAGPGVVAPPAFGIFGGPAIPQSAELDDPNAFRTSPEAATAIGFALGLGDDIASSIPISGGGVAAKRAFERAFSPSAIGKRIGAAEAKAGIKSVLPTKKAIAKGLGLEGKPEFSEIANRLEQLIDVGFGRDLPKEVIRGFIGKADAALKTPAFVEKSGKFTREGTSLLRIKDKANKILDDTIPDRRLARQDFSRAKSRREALSKILRTTGRGAKATAKGLGAAGIGFAALRGAFRGQGSDLNR